MNATVKFKLDQTNRSPSSRATCFVAVGEIRSGCIVALQTEPVALKMYWRLSEDPWLSLEDQASAKARRNMLPWKICLGENAQPSLGFKQCCTCPV